MIEILIIFKEIKYVDKLILREIGDIKNVLD